MRATTSPVLNAVRAMAVRRDGRLYAIQNGGGTTGTTVPDLLYAIDPNNGAATLIGSTSAFVGIQGLAFGANNVLYGWDTNAGLVTISMATGATTDVNPAVGATVDIQALGFAPGNVLYGARNALYRIDTATGVPTLIGSGGYTDLRGLEFVPGPKILDNGSVVTHPGGGPNGADLSVVQSNLGLRTTGWSCSFAQGNSILDDLQTNGVFLVDCFEFLVFPSAISPPTVDRVHLAIYDGDPRAGGHEINGSPGIAMNLVVAPGWVISNTSANIYRGSEAMQRVRVFPPAPILLNSALLPSGQYWLRFGCDSPLATMAIAPVTTLGLVATGNGLFWSAALVPMRDIGVHAMPFTLYGTSLAAPGAVTNLGGGCGNTTLALSVRGVNVQGGAMVHEVTGYTGVPALVIGFGDPNASFSPLCSCVLHAATDFFAFGSARYDLTVPPGVGVGAVYFVQALQIDTTGLAGLPCNAGGGLRFQFTDAYRVRCW
ncbi:MAG: hypothetical protein U1F36_20500 [Planctomycetota bacterium]